MDEKKGCNMTNNYYYGCCGNGAGPGLGAENVYSTDETVCGTWIDGKPIYRKVIKGKLAVEGGARIAFADVSELNIDKMISLYGNMISLNGLHLPIQTSYNSSLGINLAVNMGYYSDTKDIRYNFLNNGKDFSGITAYVVLEYTKQSDEPTTD